MSKVTRGKEGKREGGREGEKEVIYTLHICSVSMSAYALTCHAKKKAVV